MAITVPYSFTNATTADATEVNANFAAIIAKAIDKTGDTATGTISFTGGFNIGSATSAIVVGSQATNDLIRAASATTLGRIATANSSILATNGSGVPAYTTTIPTGTQDNITRVGTVVSGTWSSNIALTSQAALDFIYASSSSAFGRVAGGSALQHPRINAAGNGYEFADLGGTIFAYNETKTAPSISSGTLTINLNNGNHFQTALSENITTLTISNVAASGKAASFVLVLVADGTPRTVAWGASVKWASGTAPTMTSTNTKADIFSFLSYDGGSTWWGFVMGQNF